MLARETVSGCWPAWLSCLGPDKNGKCRICCCECKKIYTTRPLVKTMRFHPYTPLSPARAAIPLRRRRQSAMLWKSRRNSVGRAAIRYGDHRPGRLCSVQNAVRFGAFPHRACVAMERCRAPCGAPTPHSSAGALELPIARRGCICTSYQTNMRAPPPG